MPVVVNGPPRASEWHTLVLPNARRWGPWHVETPPLNGGKRSRSHARPPDVEACGGEERRAEAPSSSCFSIPRTRLLPSSGLFHTYLPTSFFLLSCPNSIPVLAVGTLVPSLGGSALLGYTEP